MSLAPRHAGLLLVLASVACTTVQTAPSTASAGPDSTGSTGEVDGGVATTDDAAAAPRPDFCVGAKRGVLQDLTSTPKGPYFVHHPDESVASPDTIVFVPGGPGSRDTAEATFELWLSRGSTLGNFRVIVPYSADGDLTDEGSRIVPVLDEVLACYGGSAARVHLAGTSNGGRAAFAEMLKSHDRFITLLGAPGLFQATDLQLSNALEGKRVFNGAGALDKEWGPQVKATHERLVALGLMSVHVELPGEGHILSPTADQEPFFDFWTHP